MKNLFIEKAATTPYPRCPWCDSPLEKGVCLYCEATGLHGRDFGGPMPSGELGEPFSGWGLAPEAKSSLIDTAIAGLYDLIRLYNQFDDVEWVIKITKFESRLRAILEALVEDVEANANLTRKVRP